MVGHLRRSRRRTSARPGRPVAPSSIGVSSAGASARSRRWRCWALVVATAGGEAEGEGEHGRAAPPVRQSLWSFTFLPSVDVLISRCSEPVRGPDGSAPRSRCGDHATRTMIRWMPLEPSGNGLAWPAVCTSPSAWSRARPGCARRTRRPTAGTTAASSRRRRTGRARPAASAPPSTCTSTFADAAVLGPGDAADERCRRRRSSRSDFGVSIRLEILIGASVAQSRSVQYASCSAYVVSVSRVSHLVALMKP